MSGNADEAVNDLSTVRDFIRWATSRFEETGLFYGHGTDNAWDEASGLVLHTLHLPWDVSRDALDARLTRSERKRVADVIRRRVKDRVPAAYLTSEAWFAGLQFYVDDRVLVPRSPIAELIEKGYEPWLPPGCGGRVLDLCTGSGCIGIATAMVLPEARVDLADISADALEVAGTNVRRHGLEDRVETLQGDLFAAVKGRSYELIVCNPPYVDAIEIAGMPDEFRHEPALGLAGGEDGLDIVRRILADAPDFLDDEGLLIVEVGESSGSLISAFPEVPFFWFEFERGGHGVFMLTARQLRQHREAFAMAEA